MHSVPRSPVVKPMLTQAASAHRMSAGAADHCTIMDGADARDARSLRRERGGGGGGEVGGEWI